MEKNKNFVFLQKAERVREKERENPSEISASVTKLVNFSFRRKLFKEKETFGEGKRKLFCFFFLQTNPLIAQNQTNREEKQRKCAENFFFSFFEQQSIFLILSFVVLLVGKGARTRKVSVFAFHFIHRQLSKKNFFPIV